MKHAPDALGASSDESRALQDRLAAQSRSLSWILRNAPSARLLARPDPSRWSAHEHLAHLARYHEVFLGRLELIVRGRHVAVPRYRAEDDADWPSWTALTSGEVLERMASLRARLVSTWNALSEDDLRAAGEHPLFGEMRLGEWLEFFLLHEAHHLYVIMGLVKRA